MQSEVSEVGGLPSASASLSNSLAPALRVGIVGCVSAPAFYGAALAMLPAIQVVALADADKRAARVWARQLGGKPIVVDRLDALFALTPPLDAVLITSPLPERAVQIAAAARARLPILCQIPFATTLTETDAVLNIAARFGVLLQPALPKRFDTGLCRLSQCVEEGEAGMLRQARCDWRLPAWGEASENGDAYEPGRWNVVLRRVACQTADLCRGWLGNALTVSADIDAEPSRDRRQPEAFANIIVTHERGQAALHLSRSRSTQPDERYELRGAQGHLELTLEDGSLASEAPLPTLMLHRPGQRPKAIEIPLESVLNAPRRENEATFRYCNLFRHFADCVRGDATPLVIGQDARAALEIVHAAYLSAHEGNKITLPLRLSPDRRALAGSPPSSQPALPAPDKDEGVTG